jgi:hypothetical protein
MKNLFDKLKTTIEVVVDKSKSNEYFIYNGGELALTQKGLDFIVNTVDSTQKYTLVLTDDSIHCSTTQYKVVVQLNLKPEQIRLVSNSVEFDFEIADSSFENIPDSVLSHLIVIFLKLLNKDTLIDRALLKEGNLIKKGDKAYTYVVKTEKPLLDKLALDLNVKGKQLFVYLQNVNFLQFIMKYLTPLFGKGLGKM